MTSFKLTKENFKEIFTAHIEYSAMEYGRDNPICGINFKVLDDKMLVLCSTNGNRLLKTELTVKFDSINEKFKSATYAAHYLSKIKFIKSIKSIDKCKDNLEISLYDNCLKIFDIANKILYEIPAIDGKYPNYEKLLPKENKKKKQEIALNVNYLRDLRLLHVNERTNILRVIFDKKSNLVPIIAKTEFPADYPCKQTAIIMPIQIR